MAHFLGAGWLFEGHDTDQDMSICIKIQGRRYANCNLCTASDRQTSKREAAVKSQGPDPGQDGWGWTEGNW